ncbi:MAG: S26 family signal peptidase, partial [Actinomycetota bacterium]
MNEFSTETRGSVRRWSGFWAVSEWILVVVIAVSAAFLIRTFMFQQYYIDGPSMQSTL